MNKDIQHILVSPSSSIRDAIQTLTFAVQHPQKIPIDIILIVDRDRALLGTATDGDIRRAMMRGVGVERPVTDIMNSCPITVRHDMTPTEMVRRVAHKLQERKKEPRRSPHQNIKQVIVLDDKGRVLDVLSFSKILEQSSAKEKHICVIGLGYIGLTLGLVCADAGFSVFGYERDNKTIRTLKKGKPHFYEVGLETLLKQHIDKRFTLLPKTKGPEGDIYIICVGTPITSSKKVLLDDLRSAAQSVGKALKPHDLVLLRSTLPIGTSRNIVVPILEKESALEAGSEFSVAFTPERTLAGKALIELRELPQIIGGYDDESARQAIDFFKHITHKNIKTASLEAAESVKLFNNSFRDIIFSYANEVAQLCDRLGINAEEVIRAANEGYPRNPIPSPSPGVGGYCLVKDPYILMASAKQAGYTMKLPHVSRTINSSMIPFVANKVRTFCRTHKKKNPKILVAGIAFKGYPETSDIRGSTALDIIKELKKTFARVSVYDPVVDTATLRSLDLVPCSLQKGFHKTDCVLFLNNHSSYSNLDIYALLSVMSTPGLFFDAWNMFTRQTIDNVSGITYSTLSL